jgi:hypothetical protein
VRTLDLACVASYLISGRLHHVTDRDIRRDVRAALLHQLALDVPAAIDGART